MIISGYTIDLYCECSDCKSCSWAWEEHHPKCGFKQYTGETWGECVKQARADGWQIGRDRHTCYALATKEVKAIEVHHPAPLGRV